MTADETGQPSSPPYGRCSARRRLLLVPLLVALAGCGGHGTVNAPNHEKPPVTDSALRPTSWEGYATAWVVNFTGTYTELAGAVRSHDEGLLRTRATLLQLCANELPPQPPLGDARLGQRMLPYQLAQSSCRSYEEGAKYILNGLYDGGAVGTTEISAGLISLQAGDAAVGQMPEQLVRLTPERQTYGQAHESRFASSGLTIEAYDKKLEQASRYGLGSWGDLMMPDGAIAEPEWQDAFHQGAELGWALFDTLRKEKQQTVNTVAAQAHLCLPEIRHSLISQGWIRTEKGREALKFDRYDMSQIEAFADGCARAGLGTRSVSPTGTPPGSDSSSTQPSADTNTTPSSAQEPPPPVAENAVHAPPPVPSSGVESARLGSLQAILSYSVLDPSGDRSVGVGVRGLHLEVRRDGKTLFRRSVQCPRGLCYLIDYTERLSVVRLQPGDPNVVVNLWSGGMRCCSTTKIYNVQEPRATPLTLDWPNMGATGDPKVNPGLRDVNGDGYSEFVTRDGRFPEYASQAEIALPLQIFEMRNGTLTDTTRSFSDQLKIDAEELWKKYLAAGRTTKSDFSGAAVNGCYDSCRGYLGAWAADQALLGRWHIASAALRRALQRGELEGDMSQPATGKAYLGQLETFLKKNEYTNPLASGQPR